MIRFYWQLSDGRVWSSQDADWINKEDVPQGALITPLYENGLPAGLEYLAKTVKFYGAALGELATIEDLRPDHDYELINEEWVKVRFTKKEFLMCCGMERIVKLNTVRKENVKAETVEIFYARTWRKAQAGQLFWRALRSLIDLIFFWEKDHCRLSYESEWLRNHSPYEFRLDRVAED